MVDKKILIVDSDLASIEHVVSTCRDYNYKVGAVGHGGELMEGLKENLPDLILLSVELADKNGFCQSFFLCSMEAKANQLNFPTDRLHRWDLTVCESMLLHGPLVFDAS